MATQRIVTQNSRITEVLSGPNITVVVTKKASGNHYFVEMPFDLPEDLVILPRSDRTITFAGKSDKAKFQGYVLSTDRELLEGERITFIAVETVTFRGIPDRKLLMAYDPSQDESRNQPVTVMDEEEAAAPPAPAKKKPRKKKS